MNFLARIIAKKMTPKDIIIIRTLRFAVFFSANSLSFSEKIDGKLEVIKAYNIKDQDVARVAAIEKIPTTSLPCKYPNKKMDILVYNATEIEVSTKALPEDNRCLVYNPFFFLVSFTAPSYN